jgi:hypothetical protein
MLATGSAWMNWLKSTHSARVAGEKGMAPPYSSPGTQKRWRKVEAKW